MDKKYSYIKIFIATICIHLSLYSLSIQTTAGSYNYEGTLDIGVIAINTNKKIYQTYENVIIHATVLDKNGAMICDSNLEILIQMGGEDEKQLDTKLNSECFNKSFTLTPDYEATTVFTQAGEYTIRAQVATRDETRSATTHISVTNTIHSEKFQIQRKSATRIYPPYFYPMSIQIVSNSDYKGKIEEIVPIDFEIKESLNYKVEKKQDNINQKIIWDVNFKKGKTYELTYEYKTPPKSPDYYEIGPLRFLQNTSLLGIISLSNKLLYAETGIWQLAIDDTDNIYPESPDITTEWTPSSGTLHYALVDEGTTPDTSDYISASGAQTDEFNMSTVDISKGRVDQITVYIYTYVTKTPANPTISLHWTGGGSTSGQTVTTTTSYSWLNTTFTGLNLNQSELDSLSVRIVSAGQGGRTSYVATLYAVVDYTPAVSYTQNDFEWFVPESSVTVTDIWPYGAEYVLLENEAITQIPATNNPLKNGDRIRVQMNITVGGADLTAQSQAFKIQYVAAETCSGASGWLDVGNTGSSEIWRLYDEASIGPSTEQVNDISTSSLGAEGYYSEITPTNVNPNNVTVGQNSEWDWPLENNNAAENTTYCFRMILSDDTLLDHYNTDGYPKLTTAPGTENLLRHGNIFQNYTERGSFWAD